jgi:hypothetical protein
VTVGICYQNFHPVLHPLEGKRGSSHTESIQKPRRSFIGPAKDIAPCYANLKLAVFELQLPNDTDLVEQDTMDFLWLVRSCIEKLPLSNGYYSLFVQDSLPKTVLAYMDPISQPPTRNDVVQETMVRAVQVAAENKQPFAIVSYDLAVALKAYSIQAIKSPDFDNLIILLGVFHIELALFGALGTFSSDCGIEYLLTEYGILAEGSLNGFLRGKFYNRCTRIHQIVAAVMERTMFQRYLEDAPDEVKQVCTELASHQSTDMDSVSTNSEDIAVAVKGFESFFHGLLDGSGGKLAQYWAIYVYIVNRVHRLLQRAVRMNDLDLFEKVLPSVVDIFFALNRPNYARWGSLFLTKLQKMPAAARKTLEAGAFSTRRTNKSYSRCPIDLTLEQTVNRDAASSSTGITAFTNSESALRRWCINLTQRSMAVTEMKAMCDIQAGETPANQLKKSRIRRDNHDMEVLTQALKETCDPFSKDAPSQLINIATGKVATAPTSDYLTQTLTRGMKLRTQFADECAVDDKRFLKTIPRTQVRNFAKENLKKKPTAQKKALGAAENVRDAFGHLITAAAMSDSKPDLRNILKYPISDVPLALAHTDHTMNKTEKSAFTKILESEQAEVPDEKSVGRVSATLFDGGLLMHEILPKHIKSTYSKIARDFMVKVCSAPGAEVHLLLDRYITPSIKDPERQGRGSDQHDGLLDDRFQITGREQQQKKKGSELVKDPCFKEQFGKFLLTEAQHCPLTGDKVLFISHGGKCVKLTNTFGQVDVTEPEDMQGIHEEADTLIAYHVNKIPSGTVVVRSSDTDVVVILTSLAARKPDLAIFMDYGQSDSRRFIDVSSIACSLQEKNAGICESLIGFHSLTGCDFTSSFYRKGKKKPFEILTSDVDDKYVSAVQSLNTMDVDYENVTAFVCRVYGQKKHHDIDEARFESFLKMTGGKTLTKVKKVNCASLPPCARSLQKHIQRANYVSMMWHNSDKAQPTSYSPIDFGWQEDGLGRYQPHWFEGPSVPGIVTSEIELDDEETVTGETVDVEGTVEADEIDEGEWSGDSEASDSDE